MAKKENIKKSEEQATNIIRSYMLRQNRPYSAGDVFLNLHGEVGKTQCVKILASLASSKELVEKEYGKQKIYFAFQGECASQEEVDEVNLNFDKIREEHNNLESELKTLTVELNNINDIKSTEELSAYCEELTKQVEDLESSLEPLRKKKFTISEEERSLVEKALFTYTAEWKSRKRKCNDIINTIMENYPKKKSDLLEETGVETDELAGVDIANGA
ncbi:homologous-pairing protein 2 homolog [Zophobas morio]|uniref:homologous-pairing protein 2 homolog n=1 Tax=Zophobas morio TaxID=2755281 RepID=UPI003083AD74